MEFDKRSLVLHRGGFAVFMSNLVVFFVDDKLSYQTQNKLSRELVLYSLKRGIGVIFDFEGYADNIIQQMNSLLYFSVTDDFIQLNSMFLETGYKPYFNNSKGKKKFFKDFGFFDEIYSVLKKYGIKTIKLIVSHDGSVDDIKDLKVVDKKDKSIVQILYDDIIEEKDKCAYGFTDLLIIC